ncbi:hypothetical protein [Pseudogemmobacter faecipullorum]|uniref:Stability/partitioning determinant n=1 Tax=Pseudogemmobacter faecipullorum TaxID=2755041 RepID=A0ABS8CRD2_9RHOB|nr:hypothetical protein [Pseudogemmobacter faecipullorum]MCB5411966.1 stability/partitioning determinant [Pseudogemmobacter faecipullorum]
MTGRAKIGFGNDLGDLSSFTPAPRPKPAAPPVEAAAAAGFISREPAAPAPVKQQRRHRTGRSAQINIKAKPETIEAFTAWADAQGLSIAEAFEVTIRKLSGS